MGDLNNTSSYLELLIDGPLTEKKNKIFTFIISIEFFQINDKINIELFRSNNNIPKRIRINDPFKDYEREYMFNINIKIINSIEQLCKTLKFSTFNNCYTLQLEPSIGSVHKKSNLLFNVYEISINRSPYIPQIKFTGKSNMQISHCCDNNDVALFISQINDSNENQIKKSIEKKHQCVDITKVTNIINSTNYSIYWCVKRYPLSKFRHMWQGEEILLSFED